MLLGLSHYKNTVHCNIVNNAKGGYYQTEQAYCTLKAYFK